jgi:two-component system, cell cycle sensor histidine kinase and response regulator CckA
MTTFGMRPPNLLETIFDQVFIAVAVVDAQHRVVYANEHVMRTFGVPQTANVSQFEDLARHCRYFDSSGNEIPVEQLPIGRVLAGEDVQPHNMKVGLPDGSFKWLHITNHSFSVMGLSGALMVATDETREVELQRVAQGVQKIEVLGALAGALAHNFNNIISTINLSALLCLESGDVGADARAKLEQISNASHHASDLIKRLAQFSRTQQLQPRPISINNLIHDVLALIEPLVLSKIKVVAKLHPDLPDLEIDAVEMHQVVFNLMLNARDAMPQGGQLTVATDLQVRPPDATICNEDKEYVTIAVSDTGSGIPQSIIDRIFEPFFTTKPNGTGLGLASSLGIVRQHGGDINVRSAVGNGTEFTIYLPTGQTTQV